MLLHKNLPVGAGGAFYAVRKVAGAVQIAGRCLGVGVGAEPRNLHSCTICRSLA